MKLIVVPLVTLITETEEDIKSLAKLKELVRGEKPSLEYIGAESIGEKVVSVSFFIG